MERWTSAEHPQSILSGAVGQSGLRSDAITISSGDVDSAAGESGAVAVRTTTVKRHGPPELTSSAGGAVVLVHAGHAKLHEKIHQLELQVVEYKALAERQTDSRANFAGKLEQLSNERADLWQQLESLRLQQIDLLGMCQVKELTEANQMLQAQIAVLESKIVSQAGELGRQAGELERQAGELGRQAGEMATLQSKVATLEGDQMANDEALIKYQLCLCLQSTAARYVDVWAVAKQRYAAFSKLGKLKGDDPTHLAALQAQLVSRGLDVALLQGHFKLLAASRHPVAHPARTMVPDTNVQAIVVAAADPVLSGILELCQWLTTELGEAGVLDIPH